MKQIFTTLVITFLITSVQAGNFSSNPSLKNHVNSIKHHPAERNAISVSPNPKTGDIQISFKSTKVCKGKIVVLDEAGNTVLKQDVKLANGKNSININNFNSLAEGDYTVCLNTNYGSYSCPFVLWK